MPFAPPVHFCDETSIGEVPMSEPFMSELKWVSFNFAPKGWALCNGQLLPINQNQALFSLLGTTYGGDGRVNFALPDLRGRTPIHMGQGFIEGQNGGEEFHTLTQSELPAHNHSVSASSTVGDSAPPSAKVLAATPALIYSPPGNPTTLQPGTISNTGGSQPHENRQPFSVLNCVIALTGIFPSRN
jgi:microcystin-dependent protein